LSASEGFPPFNRLFPFTSESLMRLPRREVKYDLDPPFFLRCHRGTPSPFCGVIFTTSPVRRWSERPDAPPVRHTRRTPPFFFRKPAEPLSSSSAGIPYRANDSPPSVTVLKERCGFTRTAPPMLRTLRHGSSAPPLPPCGEAQTVRGSSLFVFFPGLI